MNWNDIPESVAVAGFAGVDEVTRRTGLVAEAVVFSDGHCVLHWVTDPYATEFYCAEEDMRKIREASGRSRFTEVKL